MRVEGRGGDYGVLHFEVSALASVIEFLSKQNLSLDLALTDLVWLGCVYANGQRCLQPASPLAVGDRVRIHSEPRRFPKWKLKPRIVFEDANLLVVNKPAGLPVHALTDNVRENMIVYLQDELQRPFFITHRLDIPTSGLLILAKSAEAQSWMNREITERRVQRTYRAFVETKIETGEYTHWMAPSFTAPKLLSQDATPGWLKCGLRLLECREASADRVAEIFGLQTGTRTIYELRIELNTGRPQQIRAQLAHLGAPIIGDVSYSGRTSNGGLGAISLQASSLRFSGRDGQLINIHL